MPVAAGETIAGKYRVERVLGVGGFGTVFAARHLVLEQTVAVKILHDEVVESENAVKRFLQEARAVAAMKGDHLARVHDVGTLDSGTPFMVMEYLEGLDLAKVLVRRGPLSAMQAAEFVLQACQGLAEAHGLGIIHRDLKPGNLFLTQGADGAELIKVLDFGISKIRPSSSGLGTEPLTASKGGLLGAPAYMSPEQILSPSSVDARADIWSLGVILYELVSRKLPFQAANPTDLCATVVHDQPVPLGRVVPQVSMRLAAVVERCLAKKVDNRFSDVVDLALALAPLAGPRGPGMFHQVSAIHARTTRGRGGTNQGV